MSSEQFKDFSKISSLPPALKARVLEYIPDREQMLALQKPLTELLPPIKLTLPKQEHLFSVPLRECNVRELNEQGYTCIDNFSQASNTLREAVVEVVFSSF